MTGADRRRDHRGGSALPKRFPPELATLGRSRASPPTSRGFDRPTFPDSNAHRLATASTTGTTLFSCSSCSIGHCISPPGGPECSARCPIVCMWRDSSRSLLSALVDDACKDARDRVYLCLPLRCLHLLNLLM